MNPTATQPTQSTEPIPPTEPIVLDGESEDALSATPAKSSSVPTLTCLVCGKPVPKPRRGPIGKICPRRTSTCWQHYYRDPEYYENLRAMGLPPKLKGSAKPRRPMTREERLERDRERKRLCPECGCHTITSDKKLLEMMTRYPKLNSEINAYRLWIALSTNVEPDEVPSIEVFRADIERMLRERGDL